MVGNNGAKVEMTIYILRRCHEPNDISSRGLASLTRSGMEDESDPKRQVSLDQRRDEARVVVVFFGGAGVSGVAYC